METQKTDILIVDFLSGKLDSAKEMQLLNWIKEDQSNKELFLEKQALFEKNLIDKKDRRSSESWTHLQNRITPATETIHVSRLQSAKLRKVLAIAAAFVFGIIISSVVISFWLLNESTQTAQNITTPYGARTQFQLPDGSTVWLNSGSKLSYSLRFAKNRHITLEGEAFFEVQKGRPFIVSTNYGDVRVKGTSFNVKAFVGEAFETTLVTGLVQIRENKTGEEISLQPGFQAKETGNKMEVSKVDPGLFTSWKEGKLIFRNEYLPTVAKRLERWYNIHIELSNDSRLSEIYFSGTIEMESFTEVLELLKTTASINYSYNEQTRTIRITKK